MMFINQINVDLNTCFYFLTILIHNIIYNTSSVLYNNYLAIDIHMFYLYFYCTVFISYITNVAPNQIIVLGHFTMITWYS